MDFSTIERALLSLNRRHPPLPPNVIDLSKSLLSLVSSSDAYVANSEYISGIIRLVSDGERWEPLAVGLCLAVHCIESHATDLADENRGVYADGPRIPEMHASETASSVQSITSESPIFLLLDVLPSTIHENIEHSEPRVRSLIAKVVGVYALLTTGLASHMDGLPEEMKQRVSDMQIKRREVHDDILKSLKFHFEMKVREGETIGNDGENEEGADEKVSKASDGALDDTTGWRALETNLHALAGYIDGYCVTSNTNTVTISYLSEQAHFFTVGHWFLEGLEYCSVTHINRHVRAASSAVMGILITTCMKSHDYDMLLDSPLRSVIKESLKGNLADNWSQVRMAGSVLCRKFVEALLSIHKEQHSGEDIEDVTIFEAAVGDMVTMLLPRMCLNRFYLAQGVKLYSQDTWKIVFGGNKDQVNAAEDDQGLHSSENCRGGGEMGAVARNAAPLCRYYSKMCDADNHAVREAGCQGVAELAQKIGMHPTYAEYLSPYVPMLLQALLMCFHDESWPVRDEACLACGTFCLAYAEECTPELPTLFERWTEQLTDQIWSVREDAAVALGDAITAYGPDMLEKVMKVIRIKLPAAKDQPPMSREEYKRLQNDIQAHTNNQLYSCGSLAPKLRKGGAGRIGCSSCAIDRPKAPWEATDGCIYLIRELCIRFPDKEDTNREDIVIEDDFLLPIMTELAEICRLSHYPQSDDLRTTLWRQLPPIAQALGKKRFKRMYLDLFVELLSKNIDDRFNSASQLSIHAAGQCAEELANLVGLGIFRGRLAEVGGAEAFDRVIEERKRESQAVCRFGGDGRFSPFGPPAVA